MSAPMASAAALAGGKRGRMAFDAENAGTGRAAGGRVKGQDTHEYDENQEIETDVVAGFPSEYDPSTNVNDVIATHTDADGTLLGLATDGIEHPVDLGLGEVEVGGEGSADQRFRVDTRTRYSLEDRIFIGQILDECGGNQTECVRRLRTHPGFERVTTRSVRRYKDGTAVAAKSTGMRPHTEFEKDVYNALVAESQADGSGTREVNFSYSNVRKMAQTIAALPQWQADTRVQNCGFSNTWIAGFLKRHGPSHEPVVTDPAA